MLLGAGVLLWQRPWDGPADSSAAALPEDAAAALSAQVSRMSAATTRDELIAAAGTSAAARRFAGDLWDAREALRVGPVDLRFVSGGDRVTHDDGDATARVAVEVGGRALQVDLRVRPRDDGFDVVGASRARGALPIWLAGPVDVRRDGDDVAVGVGATPDLTAPLRRARAAVLQVLPTANRPLVVVSPRTADVAAALLDRDDLGDIAAITSTLDVRDGDLAGRVVVLNPAVFGRLDERAAQIVLSHEATHALTGSPAATTPRWVIEGFADYVALRRDDADLSVSAGQILGEVRAGQVPSRLPTGDDFDGAAHGAGAVYESSWLAFRMLAADHGQDAVVAFYRDVTDGTAVDEASRRVFDQSIAEVTTSWQAYLKRLARS